MRVLSPSVLLLAAALAGQSPELRVSPVVRTGGPGATLGFLLLGQPNQAFVTLADVGGGPWAALGHTIYLSSAQPVLVEAGLLGLAGYHATVLPVPPGLPEGMPIYMQSLLLAGAALEATDGESVVAFTSSHVLVHDFTDPVAQGITGTFDTRVRGRVQAAPARHRVHDVVPRGAIAFPAPVLGPLNPYGVRQQSVYRATDIGATGAMEALTAVRWKPVGPVSLDAFGQFEIRAAHSRVVPDYSIDPFSALPRYPDSGLSLRLADNPRAGEQPVTIYSGGYVIDPARQRADGYMPYPDLQRPFLYNGSDSLLLDFVVPPSTANGTNGHQVYVMVPSSAQPNARVFTAGDRQRLVMSPGQILVAERGDNSWFEIQLEFLSLESDATSPWLDSGSVTPDYHAPYVSRSVPRGASVELEYRGATRPDGVDATPWFGSIDFVDGKQYLQYRIRFRAAPSSGELPPSVDQIVIPVN